MRLGALGFGLRQPDATLILGEQHGKRDHGCKRRAREQHKLERRLQERGECARCRGRHDHTEVADGGCRGSDGPGTVALHAPSRLARGDGLDQRVLKLQTFATQRRGRVQNLSVSGSDQRALRARRVQENL